MTIDIRDYINGIGHANKDRDDIDEKMYCPICRGQLVVRKGRHGQFYGCENFPSGCRFTRQIEIDRNPNRRR